MNRFVNFLIPLAVGFTAAGAVSDIPTDGWTRNQAVGWVIVLLGGVVFSWLAVPVVGFACAVIRYDPPEKSEFFFKGWAAGARLTRRRGR